MFYIKVHETKKALIKDIGPVNRVHLTVLVSVEIIYNGGSSFAAAMRFFGMGLKQPLTPNY